MAQANVVEIAPANNAVLSADSLPLFVYQEQAVVTGPVLAGLYGADPKRIRENFRLNSDRFIPGKHYFKVEGKEYSELRENARNSGVPGVDFYLPRGGHSLFLWTARGSARHAKMLNTDKAWDVFELLEDSYFNKTVGRPDSAQPVLDGTITPTMQQEIRELIQAKVSAYPKDQHRKVYGQVYRRLAIKFKVPRYQEIPVAVFHDARDYIISMDVRGTTALPASNAEPQKAITEAKPRLTGLIGVWANAYSGLPLHPRYFDALTHRACLATTAFEKELQEIRAEALRPFKENRKCGIASPFDFLMDPLVEMFSNGEDSVRPAYRLFYQAIQGLKWANEILILSEKA